MAKTIMVVEDNAFTRQRLADILRRHGYDAVDAADGIEALDRLDTGPPPDLILLDLVLPRLDGWRFLERLQAAPRPAPPVIVSTGTDIGEGWADSHGCTGMLLKPFEEPELLYELRRVLD